MALGALVLLVLAQAVAVQAADLKVISTIGDVAIMTATVADDLIKQGRLVAATRTDVARGGIGVAVRAGLPKPPTGQGNASSLATLAISATCSYPPTASMMAVECFASRTGAV